MAVVKVGWRWLGGFRLLFAAIWFLTGLWNGVAAQTQEPPGDARGAERCEPYILAVQAALDPEPAKSLDGRLAKAYPYPPATGWEQVTLPHIWPVKNVDSTQTSWYRIEWRSECKSAEGLMSPVALGIDGLSLAGAVYSNGDLIWTDSSLVPPFSVGWNMPRWWQLPRSSLHTGVNTIWIRVSSLTQQQSGLGSLYIGTPQKVREHNENSIWRQRTGYMLTALMSGSVGTIFLVVFLIHRREHAYGWYALMSLLWVCYLYTVLATDAWPLGDNVAMTKVSVVLFVLYVSCFCQFTWTFGEQRMPRMKKALRLYVVVATLAIVFSARAHLNAFTTPIWFSAFGVFMLNCVQFQWHAWRTREPRHLLLAVCWLVFIVVGVHDIWILLGGWRGGETWSSFSGPIATVFMALLLGSQLGSQMRRIAAFNTELTGKINDARTELSQALEREHLQRLKSAKVQERLEIAHDLHDGLGASLVRSMAIVEQSEKPLSRDRVMSLFKVLRDDLRQVIDYGSSAGAAVPSTPVEWIAPLRYRFVNILDDLGIDSDWDVPQQWTIRPSAVQCMALTRMLEEALSNIIKHSRARHVQVRCDLSEPDRLTLSIEDNGVGFDVGAVKRAGLSVGLRSMVARAQRMGAEFEAKSQPGRTKLSVTLPLAPQGLAIS